MNNFKIAVVGIVEYKGQVLVGRKIKDAEHILSGEWHIPGGKLWENENEKEAIIREIREEAGIEIKVNRFLDERLIPNGKVKWYVCSPISHELKPGDDLAEVKYIPKEEIIKTCGEKAISLFPSKIIEYLKEI